MVLADCRLTDLGSLRPSLILLAWALPGTSCQYYHGHRHRDCHGDTVGGRGRGNLKRWARVRPGPTPRRRRASCLGVLVVVPSKVCQPESRVTMTVTMGPGRDSGGRCQGAVQAQRSESNLKLSAIMMIHQPDSKAQHRHRDCHGRRPRPRQLETLGPGSARAGASAAAGLLPGCISSSTV